MTYASAEARQQLLDAVAEAADGLGTALGALGQAYEDLDEQSADRLEDDLFRPVQLAYGRARRTHSTFAERHRLPDRTFAPALPRAGATSVADLVHDAVEAVLEADDALAELQDSMLPVEVGDREVRADLAEVRRLIADIERRAQQFTRHRGR